MSDLTIDTITTEKVRGIKIIAALNAGEKLASIPELLEIAQKTIPIGKNATFLITIGASIGNGLVERKVVIEII